MATEFVEVVVWVRVDAEGNAVADCNEDEIAGEWEADHGDLDPSVPSRIICVTLKVPKPVAVELVCEVPEEEPVAGLKLA